MRIPCHCKAINGHFTYSRQRISLEILMNKQKRIFSCHFAATFNEGFPAVVLIAVGTLLLPFKRKLQL